MKKNLLGLSLALLAVGAPSGLNADVGTYYKFINDTDEQVVVEWVSDGRTAIVEPNSILDESTGWLELSAKGLKFTVPGFDVHHYNPGKKINQKYQAYRIGIKEKIKDTYGHGKTSTEYVEEVVITPYHYKSNAKGKTEFNKLANKDK